MEEIVIIAILLLSSVLVFTMGVQVGRGLKIEKELQKRGLTSEQLYKKHKELYEEAKKTNSDITAMESLIYARLADKTLK